MFTHHCLIFCYKSKGYYFRAAKTSSYMALQHFYRVLAFSTNSFHLLLSWARVFQFCTFIFCISFLTSSTQRTLVFLLAFLKWVSRSILPLPFSYLVSFQCDRASSVFVRAAKTYFAKLMAPYCRKEISLAVVNNQLTVKY